MLASIIAYMEATAWGVIWVAAILLAVELLTSIGTVSLTSRIRAYFFWLFNKLVIAVLIVVFPFYFAELGLSSLFNFHPHTFLNSGIEILRPIELTGAFVLCNALIGFFHCWFHRAFHMNRFLWRFHRIHHSIRDMSAVNSYRHFVEDLFVIPLVTIPMALLITVQDGPTPWIIATLFAMYGQYQHSCTRLTLGPLRYLFVDNRFHRIHHSLDPQHFNKNFTGFMPIWDVVFGTAHFPTADEWPDTGIADLPEPANPYSLLLAPVLPARRPRAVALAGRS